MLSTKSDAHPSEIFGYLFCDGYSWREKATVENIRDLPYKNCVNEEISLLALVFSIKFDPVNISFFSLFASSNRHTKIAYEIKEWSYLKKQKTRMRQKKNRWFIKNDQQIKEKESVIHELKVKLNTVEKAYQSVKKVKELKRPQLFGTSSAARLGWNRATSRHTGRDTTSAKEASLTTLSVIPRFSDKDVSVNDEVMGKGKFGAAKVAFLHKVGINVVAKGMDKSCSL